MNSGPIGDVVSNLPEPEKRKLLEHLGKMLIHLGAAMSGSCGEHFLLRTVTIETDGLRHRVHFYGHGRFVEGVKVEGPLCGSCETDLAFLEGTAYLCRPCTKEWIGLERQKLYRVAVAVATSAFRKAVPDLVVNGRLI